MNDYLDKHAKIIDLKRLENNIAFSQIELDQLARQVLNQTYNQK